MKGHQVSRFPMCPRACLRHVSDGFTRRYLTPSVKLGPRKTQVGTAGASASQSEDAESGRDKWKLSTGRNFEEHLLCAPKSSDGGSFYSERPPGKDTQKPLLGGAMTALRALARWKFHPLNSSAARARASVYFSEDLRPRRLPRWV